MCMCNNIVFRLFFAVLIIFPTAWAADDLDFETLSDTNYRMSALKRAEALFSLSETRAELAEQCLNEIMLIAKGKYGLAKKRSASTEERTVVGQAIAALKRLCPATSNPFEKQKDTGDVDTTVTRHLAVLKAGFDHIAHLMSVEDTTQIEVFGISFNITKPTVISVEPVKLLTREHDEGADEGGVILNGTLASSTTVPRSDSRLSRDATDGSEEEDELGTFDMNEVMENIRQKKGSASPRHVATPQSLLSKRAKTKENRKDRNAEDEEHGHRGNFHKAAVSHVNTGGTGLESAEVMVQVSAEEDAAAQEAEGKKKEEEDALRSKSGGGEGDTLSGSSSGSALSKQSPPNGGTGAVGAQSHTKGEGDDEVVPKDNCCKRNRKSKCIVC